MRVLSSPLHSHLLYNFFFFNDTATTEIYTLSLHDALPISSSSSPARATPRASSPSKTSRTRASMSLKDLMRSEEHTSELQSHVNLVCRLLLEKKKKNTQARDHEQRRKYTIVLTHSTRIRYT